MESLIKKSQLIVMASASIAVALAGLSTTPPVRKKLKLFAATVKAKISSHKPSVPPTLDTVEYDRRMRRLAGLPDEPVAVSTATAPAPPALWPPKTVYPKPGAILPFRRIVAYYGNLKSKQMGILGELPEAEMLSRLRVEVSSWTAADPATPALPALHYVAVTAQGSPGKDKRFRLRMPDSDVQKVFTMAQKVGAIVFLDVQVGKSNVQAEIPPLEAYLKRPDVHLGLDPEFSMKGAKNPGEQIGTMDAADVNWTITYLSKLVEDNKLPPKILIVHRFVKDMVTGARRIRPTPQVQVVIDIDGWGRPSRKTTTYRQCAYKEPVQFTGFKLFYKNDLREEGSHLMSPQEVLTLVPRPIYIQYQ